MDRENNHTANKNKQSKYGKLYFIEHEFPYKSFIFTAILNYATWNYMC